MRVRIDVRRRAFYVDEESDVDLYDTRVTKMTGDLLESLPVGGKGSVLVEAVLTKG